MIFILMFMYFANKNKSFLSFEPFRVRTTHKSSIPLFTSSVQAGFPSPAEEHIESSLDLNDFLIKRPASTFFIRVQGDSMQNAGIFSNDILIVDRSLTPSNGAIIVAILEGEFTVKRLFIEKNQISLVAENPNYSTIKIKKDSSFQVWGVVTYVIHKAT